MELLDLTIRLSLGQVSLIWPGIWPWTPAGFHKSDIIPDQISCRELQVGSSIAGGCIDGLCKDYKGPVCKASVKARSRETRLRDSRTTLPGRSIIISIAE